MQNKKDLFQAPQNGFNDIVKGNVTLAQNLNNSVKKLNIQNPLI